MTLIQVTLNTGYKASLNLDSIEYLEDKDDETLIVMKTGNYLHVEQDYEALTKLLDSILKLKAVAE